MVGGRTLPHKETDIPRYEVQMSLPTIWRAEQGIRASSAFEESTMFTDPKTGRVMASFEEMSLYNMVLVEALSELLVEKGVLDKGEVLERIQKIKNEVSIKKNRPQ